MTYDLSKALRSHSDHPADIFTLAADEIERLTAENERLRAAVWAAIPWLDDLEHMGSVVDQGRRAQALRTLRTAVQQNAVNPTQDRGGLCPNCGDQTAVDRTGRCTNCGQQRVHT